MEKYIVKVNGTEYEVEIRDAEGEDLSTNSGHIEQKSDSNVQDEKPEVKKEKKATASSQPQTGDFGDTKPVKAPMSGTILSISVGAGERVEKGETIMTLEAMKMETEISAPVSGEIAEIRIGEGDNCENGAVIALIKEDA